MAPDPRAAVTALPRITPSTRLMRVIGKDAEKLRRDRGLETVGDFLDFIPRRYLDPRRITGFDELVVGELTLIVGRVDRAHEVTNHRRPGKRLEVTLVDEQGRELRVTFFKSYGHRERLVPGYRGLFTGLVSRYGGQLQLTHPSYIDAGDDQVEAWAGRQIPVYLAVKGATLLTFPEAARQVFRVLDEVPDPVPAAVLAEQELPDKLTAYRMLHLPESRREVDLARRRMAFEEALVVQSVMAQRRHVSVTDAATPRLVRPDGLLAAFDERLPFELTAGQREVSTQLSQDLASTHPMHRLLQGEVGSGKTVVALRAMLTAVDAGGQAALLAPTEVLAAQHHRSLQSLLGPLAHEPGTFADERSTGLVLLTGSQSASSRRAALAAIESGGAGIVVGTHALLQEQVTFADLALVVVDEQHRFGVEQRDMLRAKGTTPPHVLVMTATPIPRTIAMTYFGDMETSELRELPQGRRGITTHVVPTDRPAWVERTWTRLAEEVAAGRQAYVVCPRIGGSSEDEGDEDRGGGRGVQEVYAELLAHPALADKRIAVLHGRLPTDEKDRVMRAFASADLDILVATTVVEVGVDVPNASVMVVVDADRFGVSQLHQLRGRVGRGGIPGLCLLMTSVVEGPARERLDAVAATVDGFELAEVDLAQRREGDVLGAGQSGRTSLTWLQLGRDLETIVAAREAARSLVEQDPTLTSYPGLAEAVRRLDEDRTAWLTRG